MAYVDSSGKTHVSLSEASSGYAAQTTASRNAAGQVVGSSSGSNYARAQEEQARAAQEQNNVRNSIQYNTGMPAWMTAPGETAGIDRSQLQQFKTVQENKGVVSQITSVIDKGNTALSKFTLPSLIEKPTAALDTKLSQNEKYVEAKTKIISTVESSPVLFGLTAFGKQEYMGIKEKPVSKGVEIGTLYAAGAAGGAVISGGSLVTRAALVKIGLPKAAAAVEPTVNVLLGAAVVNEATKIKTLDEGLNFGKDLLFVGSGYKAGQGLGVKSYDSLRTFGANKISVDSLVKKDILSGKEQFPLTQKGANAQDVLNSYKDPLSGEFTGYHATIDAFNTKKPIHSEINRPTDVPGLYVSPIQEGASPHFLRISGERSSAASVFIEGVKTLDVGKMRTGLIGSSEPLNPNVMKISISNMGRLPEPARYNPLEAQKYLLSPEAPKGSAFLTPVLESTVRAGGRAEAEAIIVPSTTLKDTSISSKFFEWGGRKVELKEYKTVESDKITFEKTGSKNKDLVTAEDLFTSYRSEVQGYKGLISEIALPVRPSGSIVDPLRSSSSVVDPLRSSSSVVDPLRSSSSVVDPLRSSSSVVDPLRSSSSVVDPLRSSSSVVDPLRSSSSVVDPFRSSSSVVDPLRSSSSVIDPIRSSSSVVDPFRYTPDFGSTPDSFRYEPIPNKKHKTIEDYLKTEPLEQPKNIRKTKKKMLKNTYGDPLKNKLKL